MKFNHPTVLFLGKRAGAFQGARRLNWRVVVTAEKPPGPKEQDVVAAYFPANFSDRKADWAALAAQIRAGHQITAVFALTEGTMRPAAIMREALNVAGLNVAAAQRCTDKLLMKQTIRAAGLPCADFMVVEGELASQRYVEKLGLPLVLKKRIGSGGRGTQVFLAQEALPDHFPAGWLAESFVTGIEMSVESLVCAGRPIFTNFTEYLQPGWANVVPAALSPDVAASVQAANETALRALGISQGITHLEIFLTPGGVFFGELAARPPGGYIMELIEYAYGFDPWLAWFRLELGQVPQLLTQASRYAGLWILHPGRERVAKLAGRKQAEAVPGVERVSLRVQLGDQVSQRLGVGQEVGHILAVGASRDEVVTSLQAARQIVQIEVE